MELTIKEAIDLLKKRFGGQFILSPTKGPLYSFKYNNELIEVVVPHDTDNGLQLIQNVQQIIRDSSLVPSIVSEACAPSFAYDRATINEEETIDKAARAYEKFLEALRIDWKNDPNSKDTPRRVAKAYVQDLCRGRYETPPNITSFTNDGQYDGMVFQGNIQVHSLCSHHHLPFIGVAHVAYIPTKNSSIIGLSKLNRIVEHFARRPQVQENLTMQIHNYINQKTKGNIGVAVMIEAEHMCAKLRGVKHSSIMKTSKLSGEFLNDNSLARSEFYEFINQLKK